MATLKKMTRMGADVRQIARLLQAKAPEGHMLAYITPEEAKLLKSQGGSGKEHADTGIPSFEVGDSYGFTEDTAFDYGPVTQEPAPRPAFDAAQPAASFDPYQFAPPPSAPVAAQETVSAVRGLPQFRETFGTTAGPGGFSPSVSPTELSPLDTSRTAPEKGIMDTLVEKTGLSKETLARLGLAAGGSLYGAYQGKKAQEQGQAAKREQQALAEPYRAKGAELQRQAQAGELTPVGQQQLQAVQAQAAQQASGRGGAVSAAQTQAQIENFRNQLLQQQYDYGLKLSGIGDNIALGAIKTGLEADRYVQNLSNSFYTNMANIAGGMPAQAPQQYRSS